MKIYLCKVLFRKDQYPDLFENTEKWKLYVAVGSRLELVLDQSIYVKK